MVVYGVTLKTGQDASSGHAVLTHAVDRHGNRSWLATVMAVFRQLVAQNLNQHTLRHQLLL